MLSSILKWYSQHQTSQKVVKNKAIESKKEYLYLYLYIYLYIYKISLVQFSCSVVSDSLQPPWTAAHQASLSITNSQSLLKLMSTESVMPSNHLFLCCPLLLLPSIFPRIKVFSTGSALFASGGQSTGASASASVLSMNIQD